MAALWHWLRRRPHAPHDPTGAYTAYPNQTGAYSVAYAQQWWMDEPTVTLSTAGQLTRGQASLYTLRDDPWSGQ